MKLCWLKNDPEQKFALKEVKVPDPELEMLAKKEFAILREMSTHESIIQAFDIFSN